MSYMSLRNAPRAIADRTPFQGNNLSGHTDEVGRYWVVSYSTPIALYDPADDTLYVIDWSYSVTTARHQGCLYRAAHEARYEVVVTPSDYLPRSAALALLDAAEALVSA